MSNEQQSSRNKLVRLLSPQVYKSLEPERVPIERGQVIVAAGERPSHVYFPEGGVYSTVADLHEDDRPTEVALFGHEGMSGTAAILIDNQASLTTVVQVDGGSALRVEFDRVLACLRKDSSFNTLFLAYVHVQMFQLAVNKASLARDRVVTRLARWLAMCCDRVNDDDLTLTHEYMSIMLGTQRSTVTSTLHEIEAAGAIRAGRGVVQISDRAKLNELAGPHYGMAEDEYQRVIGTFEAA